MTDRLDQKQHSQKLNVSASLGRTITMMTITPSKPTVDLNVLQETRPNHPLHDALSVKSLEPHLQAHFSPPQTRLISRLFSVDSQISMIIRWFSQWFYRFLEYTFFCCFGREEKIGKILPGYVSFTFY